MLKTKRILSAGEDNFFHDVIFLFLYFCRGESFPPEADTPSAEDSPDYRVELKLHPYSFYRTFSGTFGFSSFFSMGIFIPFSLANFIASS